MVGTIDTARAFAARKLLKIGHLFEVGAGLLSGTAGAFNKGARLASHEITPSEELIDDAHHEAAHAFLCEELPGNGKLKTLSLIGLNGQGMSARGFILHDEDEGRILDREKMVNSIAMTLGGMACEEIRKGKGNHSPGVHYDLKEASDVARKMVVEYGMSDLGPISFVDFTASRTLFSSAPKGPDISEKTKEKIDEAWRAIIDEAHEIAHKKIDSGMEVIEAIAQEALEKKVLTGDEVRAIIAQHKNPAADVTADAHIPNVQ